MNAIFSADRDYRYVLRRDWPLELDAPVQSADVLFVMLNPSTADEDRDDPTIRKCRTFAKRWGYTSLIVCNLFALRATDPLAMRKHPSPIGVDNDAWLLKAAKSADLIVCAWGNHGKHLDRSTDVVRLLQGAGHELHCLERTALGEPGHPLYIAGRQRPRPL